MGGRRVVGAGAFIAVCALLACDGGAPKSQPPQFPAPKVPGPSAVAMYELAYDDVRGEINATATFPVGVAKGLDVEQGTAEFVADASVEAQGKTRAIVHGVDSFDTPECMQHACIVVTRSSSARPASASVE